MSSFGASTLCSKQGLGTQKICFVSSSRLTRARTSQTTKAVGNMIAGAAIGAALVIAPVSIPSNVTTPTSIQSIYEIADEDVAVEYEEIPQLESEITDAASAESEAAIEKEVEQIEKEMTKVDEETEKGLDSDDIEKEASGIQEQINALKSILGL
eukprot:TRINITY_DN1186_c0_g1_i3.p1 TRINITY_DN1186_c0_g1~~TRINITY_DN1186_c0_g1_i3.p1  ORF type:complete len:155 (-),score=35.46 TRINITY_DN1186_c0_g1_i3:157-621(-)